MPRGQYDRSKMKRHKKPGPKPGRRRGRPPKSETQTAAAITTAPVQKRRRLGRPPGRPPGRPRKIQVSSTTNLEVRDQFQIIRENLVALSSVRAHMKPNESTDTVDTEINKQLQLLGSLRQYHFSNLHKGAETNGGHTETEHQVQTGHTSVPLPPPPNLPVPQVQQRPSG